MSILRSILSVALLVTLASAIPLLKNVHVPDPGELTRAEPVIKYRLPETVKPIAYTITLTPNIGPDDFTFTGESIIKIDVTAVVKDITLHAKDLVIAEDKIKLVDTKTTGPVSFAFKKKDNDSTTDFLTLSFDKDIPIGKYDLHLSYTGILNDNLNGFYASWYTNERGEKVWLATTQFEPTHARRAFPCFDEPAMKATFQINIIHDDKYRARSNTLRDYTNGTDNPLKQKTVFKVTPKMSTYLVAFIVSDFESKTSADGKFRVWSKRSAIDRGEYAVDIGQPELKLLEKYTGIKETMEKMDNFAIPQFRAGAMENWGIVTYRESALLYKENVSTTADKQSIATVISHEFAHQWFGNLVSPAWWKYTWLNEGFASYFQYYITDEAETNWRLMEQFVVDSLQATAFVADDNEKQHPMTSDVASPSEISAIFDSISYQKSACVIRMFSHALTEEIFKKGLNTYLTSKRLDAATSDDLFKALADTATAVAKDVDLKAALNSWAGQAGFPVLTVTVDPKAGKAQVTQKRFLTKKPTTARTEKWLIPVTYATQEGLKFSETKPDAWLKEANQTIPVTGLKANQWVIFNKQQTGFYRVNYDETNWQLLGEYLSAGTNFTNIDVLNRAQLLDDSFNLARAGELVDYTVFLDISRYLQQEIDYIPWQAAFRAFNVLNNHLANTEKYDLFKLYILRLTDKLESSVGYTDTDKDDHVTKFNRNNAVKWACLMGSEACRDATRQMLIDDLNGVNKTSADLRKVVFCSGMRKAETTEWDTAFKTYENSEDDAERNLLLSSLGCASDTKILQSYLTRALEQNSSVSFKTAFTAVTAGSAAGINVAFDFVIEKYDDIYAIDNKTATIVDGMNEIAAKLTTPAQVEKLEKFIKDHDDVAKNLKANALVRAKSNVEWVEANKKHIEEFLNNQKLVDEPTTTTTEKPADNNNNGKGNNSPRISLPTLSYTIFLVLVARFASLIH